MQARGPHVKSRREGHVPAVIYGDNKTPETISLEYNALWKQVIKGHFTSTAFELDVEGKKHIVLARDVQLDPVRDTPLHVDFQRVGKDGIIRVAVPVRFVNETASPGLKRGGVLNIVRHDVEVYTPVRPDPGLLRDRPHRSRNRQVDPHLGCQDAGRRDARHQGPRLHDRDHRRRPEGRHGRSCDRPKPLLLRPPLPARELPPPLLARALPPLPLARVLRPPLPARALPPLPLARRAPAKPAGKK